MMHAVCHLGIMHVLMQLHPFLGYAGLHLNSLDCLHACCCRRSALSMHCSCLFRAPRTCQQQNIAAPHCTQRLDCECVLIAHPVALIKHKVAPGLQSMRRSSTTTSYLRGSRQCNHARAVSSTLQCQATANVSWSASKGVIRTVPRGIHVHTSLHNNT